MHPDFLLFLKVWLSLCGFSCCMGCLGVASFFLGRAWAQWLSDRRSRNKAANARICDYE